MPDVVIPCLDESLALPWVLGRLPDGYRAIVVDNGSSDGSADVARAHGATVVHEPRRGFGAAVHAGLEAATHDVVCVMDGDGSLDPAQLPLVVAPVIDGDADLVLGRRRPVPGAGWPVHARLANAWLARRLRSSYGISVRDLGPMRAARREPWLRLGIDDRRSGYPLQMLTRAARSDWRVLEVDVSYRARAPGSRSKVTGTVRGTLHAVADMSRVLREGAP